MATSGISFINASGSSFVDALLIGRTWSGNAITYSFRAAAPADSVYETGFAPLNAMQREAVREALTAWSAGCGLTVLEVADVNDADSGVIRLGTCSSSIIATSAAYLPSSSEYGGDVWFGNSNQNAPRYPQPGNYAYDTIIHELGHALGLKHPHEAFGDFPTASASQDAMQNTVMSYRSYLGDVVGSGYSNAPDSYAYTPMAHDIAAIQYLYGANFDYNAGNTTYRFNPSDAKIFTAIWDGGGEDTYDLSAYATAVRLDLRPGCWSVFSTAQLARLNYYEVAYGYSSTLILAPGNICNALQYNGDSRSLIENALGGSGDDTLIGNQADNLLQGGRGNDLLTLGVGADTVLFSRGDGRDTVTDTSFADGDMLCFEDCRREDLRVSAADDRLSAGFVGTDDDVTIIRAAQLPAILAGGASWMVAATGEAGAEYRSDCLYYAGTSRNAADCVRTSGASGGGKFDLSDTGLYYSVENFNDAANNSGGNIIRGSLGNNVLTATVQVAAQAAGDQMWGRAGDDLLVAGSGSDTLWYGINEGNDTISGIGAADVLRLYNVSASQVSFRLIQNDLFISFVGALGSLRVADWSANRARVVTADRLTPFFPLDTLIGGGSDGQQTIDLLDRVGYNHIDNSANPAGGNKLRGNNEANRLVAGASGDQLWGRSGADTLVGGSGADTFWVGAGEGDKVIDGFGSVDVLKSYTTNLAELGFSDNGNDLRVEFEGKNNTVTLASRAGSAIRMTTADRSDSFSVSVAQRQTVAFTASTGFYVGGSGDDTLFTASSSGKLTLDLADGRGCRSIENIDNSRNLTGGSKLRGTTGNNVLTAGSGGDQLWGRGGDDTLVAGESVAADVFWFGSGEGNDVVVNFANSSVAGGADFIMLYTAGLTASDVGIAAVGKNLVFSVGENTLTVLDGALTGSKSCLLSDAGGRIRMSDGFVYDVTALQNGYSLTRK